MRSFIALTLPPSMIRQVKTIQKTISGNSQASRQMPADQLHVTLAFIEDLPSEKEKEFVQWFLSDLVIPPFLLSCSFIASMPSRRDRLVYLALEADEQLKRLTWNLRERLDDFGIEYDRRKVKYHITIARGVRGFYEKEHEHLIRLPEKAAPTSLTLFHSQLTSAGPVHTSRAVIPIHPLGTQQ